MAQPNANREPTMEEILASIRRIIENNDVSEAQMADEGHGDAGDEEAMLDGEMAAAEASVGGHRLDESEPVAESAPVPGANGQAGGAVSLAEVAARVRASGSSAALVRPSAPAAVMSAAMHGNAAVRLDEEQDEQLDDLSEAVEVAAELEEPAFAAGPEEAEEMAASTLGNASEAEDEVSEEEAELESELQSVLRAADSALPSSVARQPEETGQRYDERNGRRESDRVTHLISASAGAKVAAAFGDLNDAFAAGPRRSFDEMAEEMLRPMLQQWLDDNLPTLVERLVREEIERVARGGNR